MLSLPAQKCAPRRRLRGLTEPEAGSGSPPPEKIPAILEANLLRPCDTVLATLDTWRRHGETQLSNSPNGADIRDVTGENWMAKQTQQQNIKQANNVLGLFLAQGAEWKIQAE